MTFSVFFEPRHFWLGFYWKDIPRLREVRVYVCLLPWFPIRFIYTRADPSHTI